MIAEPRTVEATVLVSDLRGFTALAEALTPPQTLELLNVVQGAFADAVLLGAGTLRSTPAHHWTPEHIYPDLASSFAELRQSLGEIGVWDLALVQPVELRVERW